MAECGIEIPRLAKLQSRLANASDKIAELEAENQRLKSMNADLLAENRRWMDRFDGARKENEGLRGTLEDIINWKKSSMDYDDDMGHNQRIYCEDVDLIIEFAKQFLKGADNE